MGAPIVLPPLSAQPVIDPFLTTEDYGMARSQGVFPHPADYTRLSDWLAAMQFTQFELTFVNAGYELPMDLVGLPEPEITELVNRSPRKALRSRRVDVCGGR